MVVGESRPTIIAKTVPHRGGELISMTRIAQPKVDDLLDDSAFAIVRALHRWIAAGPFGVAAGAVPFVSDAWHCSLMSEDMLPTV